MTEAVLEYPEVERQSFVRRLGVATYDLLLDLSASKDVVRRLTLARAIGLASRRLYLQGPSARDVKELFPDAEARKVAQELAARAFQNHTLSQLFRRDAQSVLPAVRRVDIGSMQALLSSNQPAILLTFHVGPMLAIEVALRAHGVAPQVLHTESLGVTGRAAALKRAIENLQCGGMVLVALDGRGTSTVGARCLGRQVQFRRGPALLARTTRAPVIPVVASWDSREGTIGVTAAEPMELPIDAGDAGAFEQAFTEVCAQWLERYLRSAPEELQLPRFRALLGAPRVSA